MNKKVKKWLRFLYTLPSTAATRLYCAFKGVTVGKGLETFGLLYIRKGRGSRIRLGSNVRIRSNGKANPIGAMPKTYLQTLRGAEIIIDDFTGISNCAITAGSKVVIGKHVRIGADTRLYGTDFHSLYPLSRTAVPEEGPIQVGDIIVKDYAFIGAGSFVLKNVTIGAGSVIGAASVVTKSVPDYEIWAGNPAHKIGEIPMEHRVSSGEVRKNEREVRKNES